MLNVYPKFSFCDVRLITDNCVTFEAVNPRVAFSTEPQIYDSVDLNVTKVAKTFS